MNEELKPCKEHWFKVKPKICVSAFSGKPLYYVMCAKWPKCKRFTILFDTANEAVEAWNSGHE